MNPPSRRGRPRKARQQVEKSVPAADASQAGPAPSVTHTPRQTFLAPAGNAGPVPTGANLPAQGQPAQTSLALFTFPAPSRERTEQRIGREGMVKEFIQIKGYGPRDLEWLVKGAYDMFGRVARDVRTVELRPGDNPMRQDNESIDQQVGNSQGNPEEAQAMHVQHQEPHFEDLEMELQRQMMEMGQQQDNRNQAGPSTQLHRPHGSDASMENFLNYSEYTQNQAESSRAHQYNQSNAGSSQYPAMDFQPQNPTFDDALAPQPEYQIEWAQFLRAPVNLIESDLAWLEYVLDATCTNLPEADLTRGLWGEENPKRISVLMHYIASLEQSLAALPKLPPGYTVHQLVAMPNFPPESWVFDISATRKRNIDGDNRQSATLRKGIADVLSSIWIISDLCGRMLGKYGQGSMDLECWGRDVMMGFDRLYEARMAILRNFGEGWDDGVLNMAEVDARSVFELCFSAGEWLPYVKAMIGKMFSIMMK